MTNFADVIKPVLSESISLKLMSASITSQQLLTASFQRRLATFYNHSAHDLFLSFGSTATPTYFTVKLQSGSFYELMKPVYQGTIHGVWSAATGSCMVTEGA